MAASFPNNQSKEMNALFKKLLACVQSRNKDKQFDDLKQYLITNENYFINVFNKISFDTNDEENCINNPFDKNINFSENKGVVVIGGDYNAERNNLNLNGEIRILNERLDQYKRIEADLNKEVETLSQKIKETEIKNVQLVKDNEELKIKVNELYEENIKNVEDTKVKYKGKIKTIKLESDEKTKIMGKMKEENDFMCLHFDQEISVLKEELFKVLTENCGLMQELLNNKDVQLKKDKEHFELVESYNEQNFEYLNYINEVAKLKKDLQEMREPTIGLEDTTESLPPTL